MNTCGTCKYKGDRFSIYDAESFSDIETSYFNCDRADHLKTKEEKTKGRKMFVQDGSGYYAALCVEDDFGCNEWGTKVE